MNILEDVVERLTNCFIINPYIPNILYEKIGKDYAMKTGNEDLQ